MAEVDLIYRRLRKAGGNHAGIKWTAVSLPIADWSTIIAALERAKLLEKAAREVAYEIERMETLSQVPQLGQIAWWRGMLRAALKEE